MLPHEGRVRVMLAKGWTSNMVSSYLAGSPLCSLCIALAILEHDDFIAAQFYQSIPPHSSPLYPTTSHNPSIHSPKISLTSSSPESYQYTDLPFAAPNHTTTTTTTLAPPPLPQSYASLPLDLTYPSPTSTTTPTTTTPSYTLAPHPGPPPPTSATSPLNPLKRPTPYPSLSPPSSNETSTRAAAEEDKRRRNTAASARFRVKKKQREQALEKTAKEASDRAEALEQRISQLEMENKWLRNLVVEKSAKGKDDVRELWRRFVRENGVEEEGGGGEDGGGY